MPSRIIAIPFAILLGVILYLGYTYRLEKVWWAIVPVVMLGAIFALGPQINWWYYRRRPPRLPGPFLTLLEQHFPYYQRLSENERKAFLDKVALLQIGTDFKAQGDDKVPEDLQLLIAAQGAALLHGREALTIPGFEVVVVYPHPFPSPQYPEYVHTSELFAEDGVFLFSAEQVQRSFLSPLQYYPLVLHEYAHAFHLAFPDENWPTMKPQAWDRLAQISPYNLEWIQQWINRPDLRGEALYAYVTLYLTAPQMLANGDVATYQQLNRIFANSN